MTCPVCNGALISNICENEEFFMDLNASIVVSKDIEILPNRYVIINDYLNAYYNDILLFEANYKNYLFNDYFGYKIKPYTVSSIVREIEKTTIKNINSVRSERLVKHGIFYYRKI